MLAFGIPFLVIVGGAVTVREPVMFVRVGVAAEVAKTHGHELEEEHGEDHHESDAFRPWVGRDDS